MSHLKGSLSTQEFNNIISSNFCFPSINRPTRVTNHSASIIDNKECTYSGICLSCWCVDTRHL